MSLKTGRGLFLLSWLAAGAMPAATLYQGATLLTLAAGTDAPVSPGYLLVSDDGLIAALGSGDGTGDAAVTASRIATGFSTVDLAGKIVLPGFCPVTATCGKVRFAASRPTRRCTAGCKVCTTPMARSSRTVTLPRSPGMAPMTSCATA